MTFGEKIHTEQEKIWLTQTKLAKKMEISLRTIS